MTQIELYDFTRGIWPIDRNRVEGVEFAFAVFEKEIKEVYKIAGWFNAGNTMTIRGNNLKLHESDSATIDNRYEFVGNLANEEIREKYLNKKIEDVFKGTRSFEYVNA